MLREAERLLTVEALELIVLEMSLVQSSNEGSEVSMLPDTL